MTSQTAVQRLLESLKFDFGTLDNDKRAALAHKKPALEAKHILCGEPRANSWTSGEKESWLLVVKGYKEEPGEKVSGVSKSITELLNGTESNAPDRFPLIYYCGLHPESNDPKSQATGLMRSLLAQLLRTIIDRQLDIDLKDIPVDTLEKVRWGNLNALKSVFEEIINRLPDGSIVHCVVDNIEHYRDSHPDVELCGAGLVLSTIKNLPLASKKAFKKVVFTQGPENQTLLDPRFSGYFHVFGSEFQLLDVDRPV